MEHDEYKSINIGATELEQLLPEAKERIIQKAMLDENYKKVYKTNQKPKMHGQKLFDRRRFVMLAKENLRTRETTNCNN